MVRGEVFRLRLPRGRRGAEQRGAPTIELAGTPMRVLVEQTTSTSRDRSGESVGRLGSNELRDIDAALALGFGL